MNTTYKFLIVCFVLVLFTRCEDTLEKFPLDQPSSATFFSNKDELDIGINGVYTDLWWVSGVNFPLLLSMDNATDIGFLRNDWVAGGLQELGFGLHSPSSGLFGGTWSKMYGGISKANNLLTNMNRAESTVSPEDLKVYEAQALYLRAFYYSLLIRFFGDVPWLEEIPSVDEAMVARTPKAEIVDYLFRDLDKAANALPIEWSGNDKGRATKGAALALKARIALEAGSYDEAANAANQVIGQGVYSLFPDYERLFTYDGERCQEVIFDLPFLYGMIDHRGPWMQTSRNTNGVSTNVPSQFLIDSYECTDGLTIDQSPLYDPSNPFENRDPRLDASIVRPQSMWGGFIFETHPDSTVTSKKVGDSWERVENKDATNPFATFTGYLWRKYTSEADLPEKIKNSELNYILFRYAEMLLTYAEAKTELNQIDNSVLSTLNQVRARAYGVDVGQTDLYPVITTTNQSELRRIIRRERKIELANEGLRMMDIRRWGIMEHVMPGMLVGRPKGDYSEIPAPPVINQYGHPEYSANADLYRSVQQRIFDPSKDYLWPIPQKEIDVNPLMTQNPGY
jgi:starch-binding outer membrane protein, SusD/RagB family